MKLLYFKLSILLLIAGTLAACTFGDHKAEKDTLRINIGAEPASLDWSKATDATSFDVIANIMVGLTQYRPNLSVAPACAASWEILDKGRTLVFHLRKNMFWSDGKAVSAQDFEYAWRRLLDPQTAAPYAYFLYDIKGAFEYNTSQSKDPKLLGFAAVDEHTFVVHLKRSATYFLYLTAFCPTYPQRKDQIEKWGNKWTDPGKLVSNGPFLLQQWQHEYKIQLVSNQHYVEGTPSLHLIKMFMIPEQSTASALYENDQLDFIDNRSFSTPDVLRWKNSPEYHNFPLLRATYIGFNVSKKPFEDVRVRKAVSMAVDRRMFPMILQRKEAPIGNWIPPSLLGYSKDSAISFDPTEARRLLAAAGYPNGKNFPRVDLLYPNREDTRLVVEGLQDQLKRNLNIEIGLVNQEWRVYLQTLRSDPPPMFRGSWGADYPDPQTFMDLFTSHNGNNDTCWASTEYDALIQKASAEQNAAVRAKLYAQADGLLCKVAVPIAPIYLSTQNIMIKPWVHGISLNALDLQFFKDVYVDAK